MQKNTHGPRFHGENLVCVFLSEVGKGTSEVTQIIQLIWRGLTVTVSVTQCVTISSQYYQILRRGRKITLKTFP